MFGRAQLSVMRVLRMIVVDLGIWYMHVKQRTQGPSFSTYNLGIHEHRNPLQE